MEAFKDFRKSGLFRTASGVELAGELSLKGSATSLELFSNSHINVRENEDIAGTFHDRSKVSLINCVTMSGPGQGFRGAERYHYSSIFPHFALFGDEHITSVDRRIVEVGFSIDDAPAVFHDFDAFGMVLDPRPHMERIAQERGGTRALEIGEDPQLFYFTGKREIFAVQTVLGEISANHGPSYRLPGPEGIHVQNRIGLNINFRTEQTVDMALEAITDTLRFLALIAGRPQNITELVFRLVSTPDERPRLLDAYWSMPPRRKEGYEFRRPHGADLPLHAGKDPKTFASILARWLERNKDWRSARARFARASAYLNSYNTDRLVGAANMFDIMPASAWPEIGRLPPDLEQARDAARQAFKFLAPSLERDSVLNALGRVGKPNLKHKIRSRVKVISGTVGTWFPDLELVTDHAVDCRNYYVHGTKGKFDYEAHLNQRSFLTDTLEFVFAASDLIDAGWDIAEWIKEPSTLSHPFARFRFDYAERLAALKLLLA